MLEVVPEGVPDLSSKATLIYPGIHIGIGVYGYSGPLSPPSPLFRNEQVSGSSPLIGSISKRRFRCRERRFLVWTVLRLATIDEGVPEGVPEVGAVLSASVNRLTVYARRSSCPR